MTKLFRRNLILVLVCAFAGLFVPKLASAQLPADQMTTLKLGDPTPEWVYVLDVQFPVLSSKVWIIDGATNKMLGQVSSGYVANFEVSPDHKELYTADTFYSRGWRGDRNDFITIFDAHTLQVTGEVAIPPKRLLIISKRNVTAVTPDGKFLLISNMTPATSVSVVDLKARKFAGEIDTTGCTQVLVGGNRRFSSICADGAMLSVTINDKGKEVGRKRSPQLFDPDKDPLFDQPAMAGGMIFFDSYHGQILPIDISGEQAAAQPAWSVLGDADKGWRPGGWQTIAASADGSKLYVLMHQGGEWTHKQFGKEVWVFDAKTHQRLEKITLTTPGYSIRVTNEPKPLLFNLILAPEPKLETYASADGKWTLRSTFKDFLSPFLLYGP